MKKIIAPFVLDALVATSGTYVAVSQLLEGFSWLAIAIPATLRCQHIRQIQTRDYRLVRMR